ncbi:hypothetical protein JYU34_017039 [Plutella xylostella]|uniref:Uncharacterized protein n=1 Tax=Plutella xylostella TaxID=51655 RepID=A0ABQ7Q439_PLUXY|nr:hypothetical protein JYU34_017039 [Plutella xylostella]
MFAIKIFLFLAAFQVLTAAAEQFVFKHGQDHPSFVTLGQNNGDLSDQRGNKIYLDMQYSENLSNDIRYLLLVVNSDVEPTVLFYSQEPRPYVLVTFPYGNENRSYQVLYKGTVMPW